MKAILDSEPIETNDNECHYSLQEQFNDLECIEKLVSEHYPYSLKDILLKPEINGKNSFTSKALNLNIKEKILLSSIYDIKLGLNNDEMKILLFDANKINIDKNESENIKTCNDIFETINIIVHKIFHKKKKVNSIESKDCMFYDDLNQQVSKLGDNIKFKEIDKVICNLKEKNKCFEFIGIKSIMISISLYFPGMS